MVYQTVSWYTKRNGGARSKKYNISLTDDELKELKSVMRKKQTAKTVRNRCQYYRDCMQSCTGESFPLDTSSVGRTGKNCA